MHPSEYPTLFQNLNTKLVEYSDARCGIFRRAIQMNVELKMWENNF